MLRFVGSKKNKRNLLVILTILSVAVLFLVISAVAYQDEKIPDSSDSKLFEFRAAMATGSPIESPRSSYLNQGSQGSFPSFFFGNHDPIIQDTNEGACNILLGPDTVYITCDNLICPAETSDPFCNQNVTFDQETCYIGGICETSNGATCDPTCVSTCGWGNTCDASCTPPTCSATCSATCGSTCSGWTCGGQGLTYDGTCLGGTCQQIECYEEEEDPCMAPGPGCYVAIEPEGWPFPTPRPDTFYYRSNSTVTFHAFVVPMLNQGVEWVIVQGESHVEIVAEREYWLILNLISPGTVILEVLYWNCEPCYDTLEFIIVSEDLAYLDSDNDGLTDLEEYLLGTNPFYYDTDGDGLPDGWEVEYDFDPLDPDSDDDGIRDDLEDPDLDGLTNHDEFIFGTHPRLWDSDGDGVSDGDEVAQGSDPNNGSDGGLPPPPEDLVNVTLTIGDISGSHSEHWMMRIGQINFKAPGYGEAEERTFRFLRGKAYKIEVLHLGTNLGTPDYDYIALVDVDDGLALVVDNDTLLGVHWSEECPEGCNMADNKTAWLILLKVDIDVDSNNDGTIDFNDDIIEDDPALPGKYVKINNDDDNENGIEDRNETGIVEGEDDLADMNLNTLQTTLPPDVTPEWQLSYDESKVKIYDENTQQHIQTDFWYSFNEMMPPPTLLLEGINESLDPADVVVDAVIKLNAHQFSDTIRATVVAKQWTFMIYMSGESDLETEIIDDFLDLASVGSDENITIAAMIDRIPEYDTRYNDISETRRGIIHESDVPDQNWGENLGEVNMGDPAVLADFIGWGIENYPAQRYCLIIDSQGDGWRGLATDWTSKDILTPDEIQNSLGSSLDGEILDLVCFDVPYSASLEVAYEVKDFSNYMIASEDITSDDGLPYEQIFNHIKQTPDIEITELTQKIIDIYENCYQLQNGDFSISSIDLSMINDLANAIDSFAQEAINLYNEDKEQQKHRLKLAIASALEFTQTADPTIIDIKDFASNLVEMPIDIGNLHSLASDLLNKVTNTVIEAYEKGYGGIDPSVLNGISLYLPTETMFNQEKQTYNLSFANDFNWDEFLESMSPEHSVYYRRYNPGAPQNMWRGDVVKGGWELYCTPPPFFEFITTHKRTIPWLHGQVASPTEVNVTLQHVKVILHYYKLLNTSTDDNGYYIFPLKPMACLDGFPIYTVCLQDEGNGESSYIRIIDDSTHWNARVSHTFGGVLLDSREELYRQLDFWNLIEKKRDFAAIYHHMMESVEISRQILLLEPNHDSPLDIYAYSDSESAYDHPLKIFLNSKDSKYYNTIRSNVAWHEFAHLIMFDSLIGGVGYTPRNYENSWTIPYVDDNLNEIFNENPPNNPPVIEIDPTLDLSTIEEPVNIPWFYTHWGYVNPATTDSWSEGWAHFIPCLNADILGYSQPWLWKDPRFVNGLDFETGSQVWKWHSEGSVLGIVFKYYHNFEEMAITSILWDLYDSNADEHYNESIWGDLILNDHIDLTIGEMWDVLNNENMITLWDIYNAFSYLNSHDTDNDGINDLDEIFIIHGAFSDLAPYEQYNGINGGETIGMAGYDREIVFFSDLLQDDLWAFDYNMNGVYDPGIPPYGDGNFDAELLKIDPNPNRH